jgi:hypothetical protein
LVSFVPEDKKNLRYRGDDIGEWLTEDVPCLLAAFGEDFIERLLEFTDDETLESVVRGMAVKGLAVLARKYPVYETHVKEHIIKLLKNTDDSEFATHIVRPIAMFHDPSLMPEISKAYDGHSIHYSESEGHDMEFMKKYIEESESEEIEPDETKVGRNAPCPCGSGKKYKRCCMRK